MDDLWVYRTGTAKQKKVHEIAMIKQTVCALTPMPRFQARLDANLKIHVAIILAMPNHRPLMGIHIWPMVVPRGLAFFGEFMRDGRVAVNVKVASNGSACHVPFASCT